MWRWQLLIVGGQKLWNALDEILIEVGEARLLECEVVGCFLIGGDMFDDMATEFVVGRGAEIAKVAGERLGGSHDGVHLFHLEMKGVKLPMAGMCQK